MKVFDLYSKRKKRTETDVSDVFTYHEIPRGLKVQIMHIWDDAIGNGNQYFGYDGERIVETYKFIVDALRR